MVLIIITGLYVLIVVTFWAALFFPNKKNTTKLYSVSVVVAARNEQQTIGTLLSDLVQQTYPDELHEIIIVNDGSTDNTGSIVDSFVQNYPNIRQLHVVKDTETGLTAKKNALNQGIRHSSGEIILSTDADCRIKPTWIQSMVSYFTDDVGMVVGFSQFGQSQGGYSLFQQLQAIDFLSLMSAAQGAINLNCPLAASGQNLGYRKAAFEQIGGFQRVKSRISGDDVLLLQLIHKFTNWKIRFAPSPECFNYTQPEKTVKAFFSQRKRWASNGSYQLQLNLIFFLFITVMFLANAGIFIGAPTYFFLYNSFKIPILCLFAKILVEFLITWKGAISYQRIDLLKYFPIWAILQMPYVIYTGISGTFGQFRWKGRKHLQELTIFRTDYEVD
ncbi:MAG TPA: glycosyltransferase [bacterium]|nr:glycosyltransferase [bacterium]